MFLSPSLLLSLSFFLLLSRYLFLSFSFSPAIHFFLSFSFSLIRVQPTTAATRKMKKTEFPFLDFLTSLFCLSEIFLCFSFLNISLFQKSSSKTDTQNPNQLVCPTPSLVYLKKLSSISLLYYIVTISFLVDLANLPPWDSWILNVMMLSLFVICIFPQWKDQTDFRGVILNVFWDVLQLIKFFDLRRLLLIQALRHILAQYVLSSGAKLTKWPELYLKDEMGPES